ncbi:MAG: MFS transporter [Anaerolineae bacterium]|nr:MFS transporter [Anaerolineae bacterium]MDW8173859.1 MFS transporter [Anaerolineae bacterium]
MNTVRDNVERANYHHLVMDIAWFGLALAATTRFLQFFALRMGATPMDIGWISSLPGLILVFSTALAGWWRSHYRDSVSAVWIPSIIFRFVFLLPAFAPFFPAEWRVAWIIASAMLPALGQGVSSAIFMMMIRDTVSDQVIPSLLTRRYLALNVAITLSSLGFGLMLDALPFPINYQIMFVVAFGFSMVSQWHLGRLRILYPPTAEEEQRSKPRPLGKLFSEPNFMAVAIVTFVSFFAFHLLFAVVPLHLERALLASEGWMGLFGGVEVAAGILISLRLDSIRVRLGNRRIIGYSLLGLALAAMVIALAPNMLVALVGAALTGAGWTAISICSLSYFAEKTAHGDMQASVVFHQLLFVSIFIGPIMGTSIVSLGISTVSMLILGALVRLGGGWFLLALHSLRPSHRDTMRLPAVGD